jgi:hypothetical protein
MKRLSEQCTALKIFIPDRLRYRRQGKTKGTCSGVVTAERDSVVAESLTVA